MAEPELIRVAVIPEQRVAVLTLWAADRRNSLTLPMVREIVAAFDELEGRDDVGAVVVTGDGSAFCAGADLGHLGASGQGAAGGVTADAGPPAAERGLRDIYEGFLRVGRSGLPTVAAVNGAAVGAGMNLALCCDVRLAARRARFDTRFLQLGLHPGGGHTWMLQRAVGSQATRAMVLFGEVLDGEAAASAGLVWRCVPDDELLPAAMAMAARAASAPMALAERTKATISIIAAVDSHPEAVDLELDAQVWSLDQPEFAERLANLQAQIRTKPAPQ